MKELIIVGAGLSGLAAAYYLKKKGIDAFIVEARERCCGSIDTVLAEGNDTPVEMRATWFSDKHVHLMRLLKSWNYPVLNNFRKALQFMIPAHLRAHTYFIFRRQRNPPID